MTGPTIAIESPDQPDVKTMFAEALSYYADLYPGEANKKDMLDFVPNLEDLSRPGTVFWVVRDNGAPIGFGALRAKIDDAAEIRWMYVAAAARGKNAGALILQTIEDHADANGIRLLRLETGTKQAAAMSLYRSRGYRPRGPFPPYTADDISIFMEKKL